MYDGGYYMIRENLVRTQIHQHSNGVDRPVSDLSLKAINAIQATPWRVNQWIVDLMRECWVNGDLIAGLPSPYDQPIPERMSEDQWARMDDEAKTEYKKKIAETHAANAMAVSGRASFISKLSIADEMRDHPAIFFPHFTDFRGRIYPVTADLTPQSDDVSKGLLQFSEGKPLGVRGKFWLAVRLANSFGLDKLPLHARHEWAIENTPKIRECAQNPLDGTRWWAEADEPWQFLATCREWDEMHMLSDHSLFISHLPINLDGTANGLQHLSALGRDRVGAKATNMTNDPIRQDIYAQVAEVAKKIVSQDAVNGSMEAHYWIGRIDRSTMKRAVMTTPYGVTDRGIRDQLISDGFVNDLDRKDRGVHADYLRDVIIQALGVTVSSAKDIMAYIQAVALRLSNAGHPMRWRTPSGNVIQQTYYNLARKKVSTLMGEFILWGEDATLGLNGKKNALAAAPNVIHSLDASHLALTVARLVDMGVSAFAMIHDSYGVHACHVEDMSRVLREEFVSMYSGDWLQDFEDFIKSYAPDVDLPERPARSDFDVSEVLQAEYFFA